MIIQNTSTINFKAKLDTNAVLETTTLKIFHYNGTEGWKQVITALNDRPSKGIGSRGYRYYAKIIGEKIIDKYLPKCYNESTIRLSLSGGIIFYGKFT